MNSGKVAGLSPHQGKAVDPLVLNLSTTDCRSVDFKRSNNIHHICF